MEKEQTQMVKDIILEVGNKTMVCRHTQGIYLQGVSGNLAIAWVLLLPLFFYFKCVLFLSSHNLSIYTSSLSGGMVFGRSLLGYKMQISKMLFPFTGAIVIETITTFGVMYFLFAIGVKMDIASMLKPERKAMTIGFSISFFTLIIPSAFSLALSNSLPLEKSLPLFAASQAISSFPVVASLLTELKIQNNEIGPLALSCSMFCDIIGMSLTAIALAFLFIFYIVPFLFHILSRIIL